MEKRNLFMLRSLEFANFKEDQMGLDPSEGSSAVGRSAAAASSASSNPDIDWKIISEAPGSFGDEIDYTEFVLDSPASGGVRPIKQEDNPERCIMALDLPEPSETRQISLNVSDSSSGFSDTVTMEQVLGNFNAIKEANAAKISHSGTNFFTLDNGPGAKYDTYINLNEADIVGKLTHDQANTFDLFRFSFLTQVTS